MGLPRRGRWKDGFALARIGEGPIEANGIPLGHHPAIPVCNGTRIGIDGISFTIIADVAGVCGAASGSGKTL